MLLATGEFCSVVIKVIWHYFHCLKLQRVASGEKNSLGLCDINSNLSLVRRIAQSQKFSEEKCLLTKYQ
jgi:hypothetical protein